MSKRTNRLPNWSTVLGVAFVVFACAVFLMWMLTYVHFEQPQPYCPQEDSCYADYENGQWRIVEGQRYPDFPCGADDIGVTASVVNGQCYIVTGPSWTPEQQLLPND